MQCLFETLDLAVEDLRSVSIVPCYVAVGRRGKERYRQEFGKQHRKPTISGNWQDFCHDLRPACDSGICSRAGTVLVCTYIGKLAHKRTSYARTPANARKNTSQASHPKKRISNKKSSQRQRPGQLRISYRNLPTTHAHSTRFSSCIL